jgi:hypothetical protein
MFYQGLFQSVSYTIHSQAQVCSLRHEFIHKLLRNGMDCMKSGTSKWLAAPHEKKAWTKNA